MVCGDPIPAVGLLNSWCQISLSVLLESKPNIIVAFANIAGAMPLADIVAAADDPSNLGKVAQVVQDIMAAAPLPPFTGEVIDLGITGFVPLVYASGGGTIEPDPDPIHDAQTTPTPHSGRNA
jgi:hypothetical protein